MKNQWLAYVIVAVISVLAGVAIAGPPNNVGTDAAIIVPATTTPATTVAPVVTEAPTTTEAEVEEPDATTTTTTTTEAPESTTTSSTTTTTEAEPEVDPSEVVVVSVNGAGTAGLATRVRNELRDAGFTQARATDGTTLVDATVVYFLPDFAREAIAVAETLDLEFSDVRPIDDAPEYGQLEGDQVVVYLGRDRS